MTNPAKLATLNQFEGTLVIGLDDGTSVILEDDGTITLNIADDPERGPVWISPVAVRSKGRTQITIKRDPEEK